VAGATSSVTTRLATNRLGSAAVPGASSRGETHQQSHFHGSIQMVAAVKMLILVQAPCNRPTNHSPLLPAAQLRAPT
jgi:hypothetical protein